MTCALSQKGAGVVAGKCCHKIGVGSKASVSREDLADWIRNVKERGAKRLGGKKPKMRRRTGNEGRERNEGNAT